MKFKCKIATATFCILLAIHCYGAEKTTNEDLPDLGGNNKQPSSDDAKATKNNTNLENKSAQIALDEAQQNFQNLTPEGMKSTLYQYGKSTLTGAAQSKVNELLSPYGHVSTNIVITDDGSMDGSSLDYLIPWSMGESNLLFNQISAHNKDGRTITNFGFGLRHNLNDKWLVGGNAFYDYDVTRGHQRAGLGAEAWTDFLKFSGNYYIPLSSWKDSPDLDDYEERPARGWDVRVQAYLPSYPQLGSSLVYEKYYGDQVALFGTDDLQKNPYAVTLGVDYTPVPLVTTGIGYKQGDANSNEITANIKFDYRIGIPLSKQLDASAVSDMRSLAGSRLDFVNRNNDIVLEYREKNDLDIGLFLQPTGTAAQCILSDQPEEAQAYEGCHWSLNAKIASHLTLKEARWVPQGSFNPETTLGLPALIPQQNISSGSDNHWTLTFPAWVNSSDASANKYSLAIVVTDEKGHTKQSNMVDIIVSEAPITYALAISNAPKNDKAIKVAANGTDTAELIASGNKAAGLNGEVTPLSGDDMNMKFHAWQVEDKSHAHEVAIHSSKNECDVTLGCLYYTKTPGKDNATIASTQSGVFTLLAIPVGKENQKTNPVIVDFSNDEQVLVHAIVDAEAPGINLLETKGNILQLGHSYQFKVAYDSNKNGKWDATDRTTVSDTDMTPLISLIDYKWLFDGISAHGFKGGYATSSTENHDLNVPHENKDAALLLADAGSDGLQGYELKVDFLPNETGKRAIKSIKAE